ncbi:MAG: type II toxin-antitoxin system Phd/YefM family antitoxin [Burkholderiales bacterium]|jgi:prevent-host-death family protein|nr:type II toxin-antitoxin system Phd/YefM family antitoxin [Burkholderiales bacterium]
MMQIRPVSDLRNKFPEIERMIKGGEPVYLTKNGYGAMVVMSLEKYAVLTDDLELKLDEADHAAAVSDERHAHEAVFSRLKEDLNG